MVILVTWKQGTKHHGKVEGHTFHKCEQYVSKFMGFINQLATYVMQYPNVDTLFENILENQMFPKGDLVHLDMTETALCRLIQRLTGRSDKTPSLSPPNCISTLMHWQFIAMILASITKEQADSPKKGEWQEITCSVPQQLTLMDGLFHPDQISMDKLHGVEQTLMELTNIPFLTLAIANCVYSSWPKMEEIIWDNRFLKLSVSIHTWCSHVRCLPRILSMSQRLNLSVLELVK